MRGLTFVTVALGLLFATPTRAQSPTKDTPAAQQTRTKLLKAKITVNFAGTPLRDCLKELAAQADMEAGKHVMWTYAADIQPAQPITFECRDKPLDDVLDTLFKKAGLGYVVVSQENDRRDGWVRVVLGDERGYAKGMPAPKTPAGEAETEDEKLAATKLATAKELVEAGKGATAKPLLSLIVRRYPTTKAGIEAKALLEKLDK
jgi:hypothetical protein